MDTISQLKQDIERYDTDALYYTVRAEHCQREAALLRQELAQEQARQRLDDAQTLATRILELDELTGAESEVAERIRYASSCSFAEIARLREIALNHSIFRTDLL
jgi:hypothetical protein